jgi:hypothetical protein
LTDGDEMGGDGLDDDGGSNKAAKLHKKTRTKHRESHKAEGRTSLGGGWGEKPKVAVRLEVAAGHPEWGRGGRHFPFVLIFLKKN